MKMLIAFILTALITSSAFAATEVVSFGRNNVEYATLYGSTLRLVLKDDVENSTTYYLSCQKDQLVLLVESDESLLTAEMKAPKCDSVLKEVYLTAIDSNSSVIFSKSEKANTKGIYALEMNFVTHK